VCGIAGIISRAGPVSAQHIGSMTRALAHRGPDDEGIWLDTQAGVALGHRRLAIIDLSPAGHQPMHSPAGRYVISFNGEIYNYEELRAELASAGHHVDWRGHSDTEVLLAGFDFWGVKPTLERAIGMFALALWDRRERALTLARDRMGEKPLYYGWANGRSKSFLFASELKAIRQHPEFEAEIDRESLGQFVRYLNVPAPRSIYRGISKVPPGAILRLREGEAKPDVELYWSGADVARAGVANPLELGAGEATDAVERTLERAVRRQMVADVPLGAFLSGGVDSSTVVAVMQKIAPRPVKTFTIGFEQSGYDEAEYAKAVARHLGTDHTEVYLSGEQAMDVLPSLPAMYDEPFADSSQIPTHLVAALAREQVTVSLSGDGGDELFGGYDRYRLTTGLWDKIAAFPMPLRAIAASVLSRVSAAAWTNLADAAGAIVPRSAKVARLGDKVHKGVRMLTSLSLESLYEHLLAHWHDPADIVIGLAPQGDSTVGRNAEFAGLVGVEWMMARDMLGYLSDDILVKVDRAAMNVSLETRMPFLDPEVIELAWRLPLDFKIRGGETKWILRQVLYRHVPPALIERPKMGFGIPLGAWLRGPLRDWAEDLIDQRRLEAEGFFHPATVRGAWLALLKGDPRQELKLWAVLMFQSWIKTQQYSIRGAEPRQAVVAS
jgi:asparagine synthase (glutamine-hydrolysing)